MISWQNNICLMKSHSFDLILLSSHQDIVLFRTKSKTFSLDCQSLRHPLQLSIILHAVFCFYQCELSIAFCFIWKRIYWKNCFSLDSMNNWMDKICCNQQQNHFIHWISYIKINPKKITNFDAIFLHINFRINWLWCDSRFQFDWLFSTWSILFSLNLNPKIFCWFTFVSLFYF